MLQNILKFLKLAQCSCNALVAGRLVGCPTPPPPPWGWDISGSLIFPNSGWVGLIIQPPPALSPSLSKSLVGLPASLFTEGEEIRKNYITPAILRAHMRAKWLHNCCRLGTPPPQGGTQSGYITPAVLGGRIWAKWLHNPCCLTDPPPPPPGWKSKWLHHPHRLRDPTNRRWKSNGVVFFCFRYTRAALKKKLSSVLFHSHTSDWPDTQKKIKMLFPFFLTLA